MDATYSMRACPKGCSRSAGRAAMRKETSEMICEPASDRLFTASACTDRAPLRTPTMNFPAASSRFSAMPTAPAMVPYARRPVGVDGSRPRRNRRQRRVVMVSYNLRGRRRRHYLSPQYFCPRLLRLDRLGDVLFLNTLRAVQVGYRARHPHDAVIAACGQPQRRVRRAQKLHGGRGGGTVAPDGGGIQLGITEYARAVLSAHACGGIGAGAADACPHIGGGLVGVRLPCGKLLVGERGQFDLGCRCGPAWDR